jgi:hypothetical protein
MPFNGSGQYNLPAGSIVADGTTIDAADLNTPLQDIEASLSQTVLRNGAAPLTGPLSAGGNNVTNLANGTVSADAVNLGQVNTLLAGKANLSGGNTFTGNQTINAFAKFGNYGGTFQGVTIANNSASGAASGVAFVDFQNENSVSTCNIFGGIETDGSSNIRFGTTPAGARNSDRRIYRAQIDGDGVLMVATTSNFVWNGLNGSGAAIYPDGFGAFVRPDNPAGLFRRLNSNGVVVVFGRGSSDVGNISVTTTSTSYNTSSDYRLKENVQPMTGALAKVAALNPVTYTWKADNTNGQGFIAHELAAVIPDAVTGEKDAQDTNGDPVYQGVDHSRIVATLTAAIQEQQNVISSLIARVEALEAAS